MLEPLWLSLARKELGTKEVPGDGDNPVVLQYARDAGVSGVVNKDAVSWCAAFVGAMLFRAKVDGSGRANARSYETWGRKLVTPCLGCVVVLNRPPVAWQGHVGFYVGTDGPLRRVRILAGNQGDAVTLGSFSLDRVVAYRWPASGLIQPEWVGPVAAGIDQAPEPSAA